MSEPEFKPKPGQVDFTHARYCPTIHCVIKHGDKILVTRRPDDMRIYPGLWGGVTGFLDDAKTIEEKVLEETGEELGLAPENIISIKRGMTREVEDEKYGKVWITHPVLVEVNTGETKLNWENSEVKWISPEEIGGLESMPGFKELALELLQ